MCRNYTKKEIEIIEKVKNAGEICCYCGKELKTGEKTIEHILPLNRGGKTEENNLMVCCSKCNSLKSDMTIAEFKEYLERRSLFVGDINEKIEIKKSHISAYQESYKNLTANDNVIEYMQYLISAYKKKKNTLHDLIRLENNNLYNLNREKELKENIYDAEVTRGLVGYLNRDGNEEELNRRLAFEIDEILEDPIIKNVVINSSIINSNILNSNIINANIDDSYIVNSNIGGE